MKNQLPRMIFSILGAIITLNGTIAAVTSNFNSGVLLTILLGIVLLIIGIFFGHAAALPAWLRVIFFAGISLFVAVSAFLMIYGSIDNADGGEDALIVLGAGVHGRTPSRALRARLDAAAAYLAEHEDAYVVVSGGQGPQEDITEAEAMAEYLISHGIEEDRILREEAATSTYENFKNSRELIEQRSGSDAKAAFVTSEYHIFRAGLIAADCGLDGITHLHSSTLPSFWLPSLLRECLAIGKYIILGS